MSGGGGGGGGAGAANAHPDSSLPASLVANKQPLACILHTQRNILYLPLFFLSSILHSLSMALAAPILAVTSYTPSFHSGSGYGSGYGYFFLSFVQLHTYIH